MTPLDAGRGGRGFLILVILSLLLPSALPHGSEDTPEHIRQEEEAAKARREAEIARTRELVSQSPWLSFAYDTWWWGKVSSAVLPAGGTFEPGKVAFGYPWLTWLSPRERHNDVFAFDLESKSGLYVTNTTTTKDSLTFDGKSAVFQERRVPSQRLDVVLVDFSTFAIEPVTNGSLDEIHPAVDGPYVAWETNDNGADWDVQVIDRRTHKVDRPGFGPARQEGPEISTPILAWRENFHGVWKVVWKNLATGEKEEAYRGLSPPSALVKGGGALWFLAPKDRSWVLVRIDGSGSTTTPYTFKSSRPISVDGDVAVFVDTLTGRPVLFALNLTSGVRTQISGPIPYVAGPWIHGRWAFVIVANGSAREIVRLEIGPMALLARPTLEILEPPIIPSPVLTRSVVEVRGRFDPGGYGTPSALEWSVDGTSFTPLPTSGGYWSVTLDPSKISPGAHLLVVRASYPLGPPAIATMSFAVAPPVAGLDLNAVFQAYVRALLAFFLDNPGILALGGALLLLLLLVGIRARLRGKIPQKFYLRFLPPTFLRVEYVRPQSPLSPVRRR